MRDLEKLAQNLYISPATPSQRAALACFEPATLALLEERRRAFEARRDFLVPALRELGFGVPVMPTGGFFVYADCSAFGADSEQFCRDVLEGCGVAITPGLDFGQHRADRHVRFAYTIDQREARGRRRAARAIPAALTMRRAFALVAALALSGCGAMEAVDYYWQGAAGQMDILARAKPIPDVIGESDDAALQGSGSPACRRSARTRAASSACRTTRATRGTPTSAARSSSGTCSRRRNCR